MLMIAEHPDLVRHAGARLLEHTRHRIREYAACGIDAVWIEELFTDQIRPAVFRELNLPLVWGVADAIRTAGLKSVYYYCGDPRDRFELILAAGADAVHFEESKKGFVIDIEEIVRQVAGRCVVFGNLDSIGVLQRGSEAALAAEVRRQLAAGRRNGGRFVMSTGSPITPGTPVARVKRYTDLVRAAAG
jgi:uroporphyrinogen-III decarboxylase